MRCLPIRSMRDTLLACGGPRCCRRLKLTHSCRLFRTGFEAWLGERRQQHASFDTIVRELLTVPIPAPDQPPEYVMHDFRKPNPMAFIGAKQGDPARLATSCARVFLGVRLECAQCHDHPFDRWTQRQFSSQAAFFAGIEKRGRSPFAMLWEDTRHRSIKLAETGKMVPRGPVGRFGRRIGRAKIAAAETCRMDHKPEQPLLRQSCRQSRLGPAHGARFDRTG